MNTVRRDGERAKKILCYTAVSGTCRCIGVVTSCFLYKIVLIQWNPVNTDTKGTCHSVCIIRVSVLSGLSEKTSGTHVLSI